ncbi:MAG: HAAS signaling domain-containing protein [Candidatus Dormibacteria bacterium]
MTATARQARLVADFLNRVRDLTTTLPAAQQAQLLEELRSHIQEAVAEDASEATLRRALETLGPPEAIAAAAGAKPPSSSPAPVREWLAIAMLTVGGIVLPVLGWLFGVILLWSSPRWRTRDKVLGTVLWPGGSYFMLIPTLLLLHRRIGAGQPTHGVVSLLLTTVPFVVGAYLLFRLHWDMRSQAVQR